MEVFEMMSLIKQCHCNSGLYIDVIEITPEIAKKMLSTVAFNRTLKEGMVASYANQMKANGWRLNGETIVFDNDGQLVNGNTRLTACVKSGSKFKTVVVFGVDSNNTDIYDFGAKRRLTDIMQFKYKSNDKIFNNMGIAIMNYLISFNATGLSAGDDFTGFTDRSGTVDEQVDAYTRYGDSLKWVMDRMRGMASGLSKSSVLAGIVLSHLCGFPEELLESYFKVYNTGVTENAEMDAAIIKFRDFVKAARIYGTQARLELFKKVQYSLHCYEKGNSKARVSEARVVYYSINKEAKHDTV